METVALNCIFILLHLLPPPVFRTKMRSFKTQSMISIIIFFALFAIATNHAKPLKRQNGATKVYCTPSQPCWPKESDWANLNASINGQLIRVIPWQSPCYVKPNGFQQPACQTVRLNYFDGVKRSDQIGATQLDNW